MIRNVSIYRIVSISIADTLLVAYMSVPTGIVAVLPFDPSLKMTTGLI